MRNKQDEEVCDIVVFRKRDTYTSPLWLVGSIRRVVVVIKSAIRGELKRRQHNVLRPLGVALIASLSRKIDQLWRNEKGGVGIGGRRKRSRRKRLKRDRDSERE